jgi:transposase
MDRESLLDDAQWELIEPLLPPQRSGKGRPMRDHRLRCHAFSGQPIYG